MRKISGFIPQVSTHDAGSIASIEIPSAHPIVSKQKSAASETFSAFCFTTHTLVKYFDTIFMVEGEDADQPRLFLIIEHRVSVEDWEKTSSLRCFEYKTLHTLQ